jgi:hypothetical protein
MPVGACPACWPVYVGLLGVLGFGFLLDRAYLLPVSTVLLTVALWPLAHRATSRHGYGPFIGGTVVTVMIFFAKFLLGYDPLVYAGLTMLMAMGIWNAWPLRSVSAGSCPQCSPARFGRPSNNLEKEMRING